MHDFWGLSDADLAYVHRPEYAAPPKLETPPHTIYRYDDYRWDEWDGGDYVVLQLTKGYFTFINRADEARARLLKYLRAREEICPETGRVLKVRAVGEIRRKKYYLHRFLLGAKKYDIVDHFNHHPLDNRQVNLVKTSQGTNLAQRRYSDRELPRGVEKWGHKFGGVIHFEDNRYRSEEKWDNPQSARQWYLQKHLEFYGYLDTSGAPRVRNYPIFPPRITDEINCPF